MAEKMIRCDCGYTVRAATDDELVADVQAHAREVHNMEITREQVLAMSEPISTTKTGGSRHDHA